MKIKRFKFEAGRPENQDFLPWPYMNLHFEEVFISKNTSTNKLALCLAVFTTLDICSDSAYSIY